jgi:acetyltransferase-like isoleucine patch superfamily enzyme
MKFRTANVNRMKHLLNELRNVLLLRIRHPWIRYGKNVHCHADDRFCAPNGHIVIGNHVGMGVRCLFLCDVEIGNKVLIASNVAFLNSREHRIDLLGKTIWDSGRGPDQLIIVEDDVWIGHGSIILSPARIGRGAVIAAGSIVTHDVPRYGIVAGVPARLIRMRFEPEQIVQHEHALAQEKGVQSKR